MRSYRNLVESLPAKTVVFAYGRFSPPSADHQLLIQFVRKLAQQKRAEHMIVASYGQDAKKNPLSQGRRAHYMELMFPGINVAENNLDIPNLIKTAVYLNHFYSNLIFVTSRDQAAEQEKILNKYNGSEYSFKSIQVIPCCDTDPDAGSTAHRALAAKGDFESFRKCLPPTAREIDARRLMNDIREGMGLEPIKEVIRLNVDSLRESYFRGDIFNVGDLVESVNGEKFEIVKRGTNHLLVKSEDGKVQTKWIHEVFEGQNNG